MNKLITIGSMIFLVTASATTLAGKSSFYENYGNIDTSDPTVSAVAHKSSTSSLPNFHENYGNIATSDVMERAEFSAMETGASAKPSEDKSSNFHENYGLY